MTNSELFLELVFASAVTRLSRILLRDPSAAGAAWGKLAFKRVMAGRAPLSHLVGRLLALPAPAVTALPVLAAGAATSRIPAGVTRSAPPATGRRCCDSRDSPRIPAGPPR